MIFQYCSAVKQIIDREINAHLRNTLWIMRKSCNHPYLVDYPLTSGGDFLVNENLVKCSGKLLMLDRMLHKLKAGDHKVKLLLSVFLPIM